ncbi:substrate-binding periplasmic protein [Roseospirillum parvum]|uniref:substrate-binding periplasmic protein n=1 Tax=Roseospirillum parvum TaxID=83401 RepID=UPI0015A1EF59|nr:transporter substrate-binding domain-containing protein [Roseospirillum parvum]
MAVILPPVSLLTVTLLTVLVLLAGLAPAAAESAGGFPPIGLRLGTDIWPPYEDETEDGEVVGLSSQIIRAVLADMAVPVAGIKTYPWARGLHLLERGRIDGLFSGIRTAERAQRFLYPTEALVRSFWVVVVRRADAARFPFTTWDDLRRGHLGVVRGYSYGAAFDAFLETHPNLQRADDLTQNLRKLDGGRVDYVVADLMHGRHLIHQLGLDGRLVIAGPRHIAPTHYYVFFSPATVTRDFVDRFNAALGRFKATPRYRALVEAAAGPGALAR